MKHLLAASSLCVAFLGSAAAPFDGQNPIEEDLGKAKARYQASVDEQRQALLAALEALVPKPAEGEEEPDPTAVALARRVQADRTAFVERGVLPATAADAARKFEKETASALKGLWKALERAEEDLHEAALHERAQEVKAEREGLRVRYERCSWNDIRIGANVEASDGWRWDGASLVFDSDGEGRLHLTAPPWSFGGGYRIELVLQRTSGSGGFQLIFPRADLDSRGLGLFNLGGLGGRVCFLEQVAGTSSEENPTRHVGDVLSASKTSKLVLESTAAGITVKLDGKTILSFNDFEQLTLPKGVLSRFKSDRKSIYLAVPAGTTARLESAFSMSIAPEAAVAKPNKPDAPAKPAKPAPEDRLPVGRRFKGKWNSGPVEVPVVVVQRDREGETAALDVTGGKGGVFRFTLDTKLHGATFEVTGIRQITASKDHRFGLVLFESGKGYVTSKGKLRMSWKARFNVDGVKHEWNGVIEAELK